MQTSAVFKGGNIEENQHIGMKIMPTPFQIECRYIWENGSCPPPWTNFRVLKMFWWHWLVRWDTHMFNWSPFQSMFHSARSLISHNWMSSFQFSCRSGIDWPPRNCIHMEYKSSLLSYPNLPFDQSITHNDKGSHDVRICTEWRSDKGCFYRKNQPRVPS